MAAGIPIIGTKVGGIPDFLTENETGLFCEVRDPRSIADAVKKYLDDSALVSRVVVNAMGLVAEKYDWEKIASDMQTKIFDRFIKRG
jgi:glycosyltransferase involved in cell wall biosynthesis